MSRCKACNNVMSDMEMRRRDVLTGDFSDLCTECLTESDETREVLNFDEVVDIDVNILL